MNIYDCVYQLYQNCINNNSDNSFFNMYAIKDLASILHVKILVFTIINDRNNYKLKVYDPVDTDKKFQEYICLLNTNQEPLKFKLLMPNMCKNFIEKNLIKSPSSNVHFLKASSLYSSKIFIVSFMHLVKCFKQTILNDFNFSVFIHFLSECPVHLLICIREFSIDIKQETDSSKLIQYLNQIWGKDHFSIKKIKIRMSYMVNII